MVDSLSLQQSGKSAPVIDLVLEVRTLIIYSPAHSLNEQFNKYYSINSIGICVISGLDVNFMLSGCNTSPVAKPPRPCIDLGL